MTPQELKNNILQLAIQGKLVEQRPEEGTAEELYRQIQAEKQRLVKAGKIKKEKPLPAITEDEVPFEIPERWKWCHVGAVFDHNTGKAMNSSARTTTKSGAVRKFITTSNVYWNSFELTSLKEMFFSDDELERCTATQNDILMCEGGAYYGRTAIWKNDYDICFQNHIHRLRSFTTICEEFFYYVFFFYRNKGMMQPKGTAMPGLSSIVLHNLIIPLPPLAEQKRIVAKIEELLPLIDRYEKAWSKLEEFNKRFPVDMQKSLLQMAIQGKLVEQRPEEGTGEELYRQIQAEKQRLVKAGKIKKEKPLPAITEDEIPFDIPESWRWVRLGVMAFKVTDGTHKTPCYTDKGIKFVSAKNLYSGSLNFEECKYISEQEHRELFSRCNPGKGDLLVSKSGSIGGVALVDIEFEFSLFESLALVKYNQKQIYPLFLKYAVQHACLNLNPESVRGVAVKHLPIADIKNIPIPLPPLAEQKRIVERLTELLAVCDKLK